MHECNRRVLNLVDLPSAASAWYTYPTSSVITFFDSKCFVFALSCPGKSLALAVLATQVEKIKWR